MKNKQTEEKTNMNRIERIGRSGIAAVILGAGLGLATQGCCKKILQYDYEHPPTLEEKHYEAEREYVKNGEVLRDDEDYILTLRSDDVNQTRVYQLYVPQEVYETLRTGEAVDLTKIKHHLLDPDYVKNAGCRYCQNEWR